MREFIAEFHELDGNRMSNTAFHIIKAVEEDDMILQVNDKVKCLINDGMAFDIIYYETNGFNDKPPLI